MTGREVATLPSKKRVKFAALQRAGKIITPGVKWNPDTPWNPYSAALAPNNHTLAMNCDSYLEVWSLEDGKAKRVTIIEQPFDRPQAPINAFAFSPDGERVAFVGYSGDGLAVWNLTEQKRMFYHPMKLYQDNTYSYFVTMRDVTFTPDGRTVVTAGTCHYSWGDILRQEQKTARTCWLRAWNAAAGAEGGSNRKARH